MLEDYFPEFITVTCYDWLPLISSSNEKEIIIQSLQFLTNLCLCWFATNKLPTKQSAQTK